MIRDDIFDALRDHKATLAGRFGVAGLMLFGSFARNDASADSDLLVQFGTPATSKRYCGAQFHIEDLLGRQVDLVTYDVLHTELRPYVEREVIRV